MKCSKCGFQMPEDPCFLVNISVRHIYKAEVARHRRVIAEFVGSRKTVLEDCQKLSEAENVNMHFHWDELTSE